MGSGIRIGISSCLVGERVRYDGKQKAFAWACEELPKRVEIVRICPEVAMGMPVPRPPIQLVGSSEQGLRLLRVGAEVDHSEAMIRFADAQIAKLRENPISGYVFKARSPSCGLKDTPRFSVNEEGAAAWSKGAGMWARALRKAFPNLPVTDEAELASASGQEKFWSEVASYAAALGQ